MNPVARAVRRAAFWVRLFAVFAACVIRRDDRPAVEFVRRQRDEIERILIERPDVRQRLHERR